MKPTISLSLKQQSAPKNLMRQLVKLLPLNETQLEDTIRREVNNNPFLSFPVSNHVNIENVSSAMSMDTPSIYKIIIPQIESQFNGEDYKIAMYFLGELDDDGFLRDYNNTFGQKGIDVLEKLHTLEPSGVFSRNLQEFYHNYLKTEGLLTPLWERFIAGLDTLAMGDAKSIIKSMGSQDVFNALMQDLRDLPSSPNIEQNLINTIIADVTVTRTHDSFSLQLQSKLHTILEIDNDYVNDVRTHTLKSQDRKFITEKFASAKWLKSALQMRAETLLNIATVLVNHQSQYLNGGNLKPLTMVTVAEKTNVHISTVSRISNNKYMQTPRGTITFKDLFSAESTQGISQDTVVKMIQALVENEIKNSKVLSDEKIMQCLAKNNVTIARRTVTKYREIAHIPSSTIRKQKLKFKRT